MMKVKEIIINIILISRISVSNVEIKQVDKSPKTYMRARIMNSKDDRGSD